MLRKIVILSCLVLSAVSAAAAKERSGTVTFDFILKASAGAKEVRLWVPYPQNDRNQLISDLQVLGNFTFRNLNTEPKDGNAAVVVDWKVPVAARKLTYRFTAIRKEVIANDFPKTEGPVSQMMIPYLDLSTLGRSEQRVKELAADITKGQTTILAKARAVYDWIVENMRWDPKVKGCGLREIDRLLDRKGGKCSDIHSVFTALARAAGVPAREIYGIRIPKDREGDMTKLQHCWAEFFLPGYGWVVVDPADVLKFKLEKKPSPGELKATADYFFGAVDENRVQLSTGDHVLLNPAPKAGALLYFLYPYAEADGKPLNKDLYGFNIGYTITFSEK